MSAHQETLKKGLANKKDYLKLFADLKRKNSNRVDEAFRNAHQETFENLDCLTCANCCKTTSPLFIDKDVERLAHHFKMSTAKFESTYLKIDSDGDKVLQSSPCVFLNADNTCMVYEVRPKACREYPHTNRKNISGIAKLTIKNAEICPAVVKVLEVIQEKVNQRKL